MIPELEFRTVRKFLAEVNIHLLKCKANMNINPGAHFWAKVV